MEEDMEIMEEEALREETLVLDGLDHQDVHQELNGA